VKKNRLLLYGYLDLILFECEKYDPDITLGVALQAYAGLREGEVVNVSYDRIKLRYGGFGTISDIEINLESPASFADKTRKSGFGSIKIPRKQLVYPDFTQDLMNRLGEHSSRMESMGYAVTGENPILLDKWGHPMSVHTYTNRVKRLFIDHFLPDLKKASEAKGSWFVDAPYIEAYENEYPGAHAFRHWYTMYLIQHTNLKSDEVSKWRGDSNRESVLDYIHANSEMLDAFGQASHTFQKSWLCEVLRDDIL
jgi:integrase